MLLSLCCSVVIMLYCYCVALLLFVLSYVLIVCTVPLPPGVNPIAFDKYIISSEIQHCVRKRTQSLVTYCLAFTLINCENHQRP